MASDEQGGQKQMTDQRAVVFADKMTRLFGRGPLSHEEVRHDMRRTVNYRTFVCQGCGRVHIVLYGRSIICGCGARSAAEIIGG